MVSKYVEKKRNVKGASISKVPTRKVVRRQSRIVEREWKHVLHVHAECSIVSPQRSSCTRTREPVSRRGSEIGRAPREWRRVARR